MSDGNFNRSMLHANSYQSGVRAGEARMKVKAERSFTELIYTELQTLGSDERNRLIALFRQKLTE